MRSKTQTLWFHGGPRIRDWSNVRWERPKNRDQNAEGPGVYWTESREEAVGYMENNGDVLYVGVMNPEFRKVPDRRSTPRDLRVFFGRAPREDQDIFLVDRGLSRKRLDQALEDQFLEPTLFKALSALYVDLFRRQPDPWVAAMRATGYDGAVVKKPTGIRHLVLWNPKAMVIEEIG